MNATFQLLLLDRHGALPRNNDAACPAAMHAIKDLIGTGILMVLCNFPA